MVMPGSKINAKKAAERIVDPETIFSYANKESYIRNKVAVSLW